MPTLIQITENYFQFFYDKQTQCYIFYNPYIGYE